MQGESSVTKMHQEGSKKILIRMVTALVVLAAVAGGYLLFQSKQPNYTMTQAPKGEVVAGFPSDLIVEKGVVIQNSYSLTYAGAGLNQPVVTYISNWPMVQNVVQFGAYLRTNKWTVTHEADPLSKITFYYANKDNNDVNITLAEEAGKVKVTISYIKR